MSTSFAYGEPGKKVEPLKLSGSVVELPAGVSVTVPACGGSNAPWPSPPPPPPQLASATLASSNPSVLCANFICVLQGTSFRGRRHAARAHAAEKSFQAVVEDPRRHEDQEFGLRVVAVRELEEVAED